MQHDEHYGDLQWLDYLNGRIPRTEARKKMEEHLDACEDCRTRLSLCQTLQSVLGDKTPPEPPGEWVREGVSLFDPKLFNQKPEYLFAMLTSDSLVETDSELRSGAALERQLSFESTEHTVCVLLETSGSSLKGIVGQLSGKGSKTRAGGKGQEVELHVRNKVFRTELTEFSEFLFRVNEQLDGNPIELRFRMKEGPCLALLIPC